MLLLLKLMMVLLSLYVVVAMVLLGEGRACCRVAAPQRLRHLPLVLLEFR